MVYPDCTSKRLLSECFHRRHPLLISYLFRDITYHLDPVLSASQPHGSGTPCLSASAKHSHFLLSNAILTWVTFSSQLTTPPSDPPSNLPWFFNRLWRCISFVLIYLLTYLLILSSVKSGEKTLWYRVIQIVLRRWMLSECFHRRHPVRSVVLCF